MNSVLVTGPTGFLGYHVIKLLNERGISPRVLLPTRIEPDSPAMLALNSQNVEIVKGNINDADILKEVCKDIDTVFHLYFALALGSGEALERHLHNENVMGTSNLVDAAAQANVSKIVISSSALTIGMHYDATPLDETADWEDYKLSLSYAASRRHAEQAALAKTAPGVPDIIVVNPSFTLGPEDWAGAPANKLVMRMSKPGFRFTAPIGFGALDVRDYADGVLRAAERGKSGQRYILSGSNINAERLIEEVAGIVGFRPPKLRISLRASLLYPIIFIVELISKITGKPPKVSRNLLEIWDRYAWYDTSKAQNELGWRPRPLQQSLQDTIEWHRQQEN
ncbi:MAG: NAD-dependent epimerase/dehydratase family protein [Burkholderiales bacterium]|nr:NAD-dependent epimerase/dehydratase family protein [Nitrosomonas sp.]MCP5275153.1 NAD-dependent epimerase/dehydratase family protein [Burkholderiales bacterium]